MFETELQQTQLILGIVVIVFGFFIGYTKFVYKRGRDKGVESVEITALQDSIIHKLDDLNQKLDGEKKTLSDHIDDDKTEFGILHTRITDSLKDLGDIKKLIGELDGKLKFIIRFYDESAKKLD